MGGSPTRSRSSKYSSSRRRHRSRSRSVEKDYRRDRRSKSRSPSKYSRSRRSSSKHKSSSSRRRYRSSSSSSYSSDSRDYKRSPSPEQKKPAKKVPEKILPIPEPEVKVFESVNSLHDKDTKATLDDLEQEVFVPKAFSSSKKTETDCPSVTDPKKLLPDDSLLHYGLFGDDEARMEKWIKKLYNYRQKANVTEMDTR